jgi:hypothetical protein
MRPFLLLICAATVVATVSGGAAHAVARPSIFFADSSSEQPGATAALELYVSLAASAQAPDEIVFTAPAGYGLTEKPIGGQLGVAAINIRTPARALQRPLVGTIVNVDPATLASDPVLHACAPGAHTELWQLSLLGSVRASVPIAVDRMASGGSYALTVCLAALRTSGVAPVQIDLGLVDVKNPVATGVYGWSALVTPFGAAGAPDAAGASELRGDAPLPQLLTVRGSYDAKTKLFVARGRLVMAGKPRAGVAVNLRGFASDGPGVADLGFVRTTANGAYTFRKRLASRPRYVSADVDVSTAPCTGPSTAPAGCTSESVPGADAGPVAVARATSR